MNIKSITLCAASCVLPFHAIHAADTAASAPRPNIVLIMTDDMGFSDLGCYGGEIETPHIDKLATSGLKFSQFYNAGKCEPTRAALVTGHHWWTHDPNVAIRKDSPNFGEALQTAGYRTLMVGKWHCDGVPFERGFDRHYGFMGGATNFFKGDDSFTLDGKPWPVPEQDFYVTNALSDYAERFIREESAAHPHKPFFLYLAYNAPHSPLQAPESVVAKYRGKYRKGWDVLRKERFEKQRALGLAGPGWNFPERPDTMPAWDTLSDAEKDFQDQRMATYAAMVDVVDQGVGQVVAALEELGIRDNTLIIFLNDNGASPNDRVRRGEFNAPDSNWNLGGPWAHASNSPFKFYKRTQHSGGVTTPFIASWPSAIAPRETFEDQPSHVVDLLPTFMDLAGKPYPHDFGGKQHPPLPGRSIGPILTRSETLPPRTLFFQLFTNIAVVDQGWRLVTAYGEPWHLYDLTNDRTETRDLSRSNPKRYHEMLALQKAYSERPDVRFRINGGEKEPGFSPILRANGTVGPGFNESIPDRELQQLATKIRTEGREPSAAELATLAQQLANEANSGGDNRSSKAKNAD